MSGHWPWWPNRFCNRSARRIGRGDGLGRHNGRPYPARDADRPVGYCKEVEHVCNTSTNALAARYIKDKGRALNEISAADGLVAVSEKELAEAEERYRGAPVAASISPQTEWGVLALGLFAEFPLNAFAFELLRRGQRETWLMTCGVAVGMVVCAAMAGRRLKEPRQGLAHNFVPLVAVLIAIATIVIIAMLRSQVAGNSARDHVVTLTYVSLQSLIFIVCVWVTYSAHDPLARMRRKHSAAKQRLKRAHERAARVLDLARSRVRALMETAHLLVTAYEGENTRWRSDGLAALPRVSPKWPEELVDRVGEAGPNGKAATSGIQLEVVAGGRS